MMQLSNIVLISLTPSRFFSATPSVDLVLEIQATSLLPIRRSCPGEYKLALGNPKLLEQLMDQKLLWSSASLRGYNIAPGKMLSAIGQ